MKGLFQINRKNNGHQFLCLVSNLLHKLNDLVIFVLYLKKKYKL